jgi:type IV secretory pathway VirB10-like protein
MSRTTIKKAIAIVALQVAAGAAFAQFAWIDANGVRQYSDQPPPSSIPKNRILKQPAAELRAATPETPPADTSGAKAANGSAAAANVPMSLAEKNADYTKRKIEQAEKDKKSAEDAKLAADKAANCDRARQYARALQSGDRISSVNKDGEREYMSDDKRAKEVAVSSRALEGCK